MFRWLDRVADESHRSHRVAGTYHLGYVAVYGVLVGLYVAAIAFHLAATRRHYRAAERP
jgi:hypothetical protein